MLKLSGPISCPETASLAEAAATPVGPMTRIVTLHQYNNHRPRCHPSAFPPSLCSPASRARPPPALSTSPPTAPTQPATPTPTESPPTTPTRPSPSRTFPTPMPLPSQPWVCATPLCKRCPRPVRSSDRCRRRTEKKCGVRVRRPGRGR